MCNAINIKKFPVLKGLLFALLLCWNMLSGQNVALNFDGANDYVNLNPISNFAANTDFTVEMQFYSSATGGNNSCIGNFHRLFSLGTTAAFNASILQVGECGGYLSLYWQDVPQNTGLLKMSTGNIRDNQWHCISVVRSGSGITTYLDGSLVTDLSTAGIGAMNFNIFRVGHWQMNTATAGQDWEGVVDEVKLWNVALAPSQLTACNACVLTGDESGLTTYWRFDDGTPNGNNTGVTSVKDESPNNNDGIPSSATLTPPGFTLNSTNGLSNFVSSTAPILYPQYDDLDILLSDPFQPGTPVTAICSGDPVHFAIVDANGVPVQAGGGATVAWEYSDDCVTWNIHPITPGPGALFNGFSFVSPPSHSALDCGNPPTGFVERCYRAVITVTNGSSTCTYIVESPKLTICCPVANVVLNVTPMGPLCENDMTQFTATLTSNMPTPGPGNNVHINWMVIINGVPTALTGPNFVDKPTILYPPGTGNTVTLAPQSICFKATISNCICPAVTIQKCIVVDPKPVCGTITGSATPGNLMPDPDGNPDHYLICPGNDAAVEIATPFTNCTPVWQYMFPSVGVWNDLGTSNSSQNTNTLPHLKPAGSPYLWPPNETCIIYRIECRPFSYPNSGCPPCHSNEVRICLKTAPTAPVITAVPNPICKGSFSYLSVQNPDPNCTYEWWANGVLVGFGDFLNANQKACYWVTCNDGCFTVASNKVCLDVCESVAVISCPVPICPCIGDKITIDGFNSYSTCGYSLTYTWTWTDVNGVPQTFVGPVLMDVPAASGTTYTLTVTDTVLGCSDSTMTTIKPCQP